MSNKAAFRFQYADGSAFEIFANGEAHIVKVNGNREQAKGLIINRIPELIARATMNGYNEAIVAAADICDKNMHDATADEIRGLKNDT